jgi:hypothetical protein
MVYQNAHGLVKLIILKYWALIAPALIFYFQHDERPILFNVMAHLKFDIYPFQVTLQDTCAMLLKVVQSYVLPFENVVVQF